MALNRIERRRRIHYRIRKHVNGTAERPRMVVFRWVNKEILKTLQQCYSLKEQNSEGNRKTA